MHRE